MNKTLAGVYHNIQESEFVVTDGELYIFFSSSAVLKRFLTGYEDFREKMKAKFSKITNDEIEINQDALFDLLFYKKCEKRGFYSVLNGKELNEEDWKQYAIQKMLSDQSPVYQGIFLVKGYKELIESEGEENGEETEKE
jgi:hypothetical protein